jgi:hypothetical protein
MRSPQVGPVTVAGEFAAYGLQLCRLDGSVTQVVVRRLTDGKKLRVAPSTSSSVGPEPFQSVASLVIKSNGAVAWTAVEESVVRHSRAVEVDRADVRGQALLDSGPGIDVGSLRLRGSDVTWRHDARTRSAELA